MTSPSVFENETAVRRTGETTWSTTIHAAWNIGENPNGGYLVSPILRAMRELGVHQDPLSVTTHYLRPGSPDQPATIEVEMVRSGRSMSTFRGSLIQDGKARLEVLACLGELPAAAHTHEMGIPAPDLPDPEECILRSAAEQGVALPILDRVEMRIPPEFAEAGTRDRAEMQGWIRLRDGSEATAASLVLFADSFPPTLFMKLGHVGWVPTIELTVHVRRRPAPGWIRGSFHSSDLTGGRFIEDGALWDSTGALVAQSRQMALLRTE